MFEIPKIKSHQWNLFAEAFSHIAQGIILFSLGAYFIPKAVGLPDDFPVQRSLNFLLGGLILLIMGAIIAKKR